MNYTNKPKKTKNNNQKNKKGSPVIKIIVLLLAVFLTFIGTASNNRELKKLSQSLYQQVMHTYHQMDHDLSTIQDVVPIEGHGELVKNEDSSRVAEQWWYKQVPKSSKNAYVEVNDGIPFFLKDDLSNREPFETYSDLDYLGRCGVAYANICKELMPTSKRGDISKVTPTGWVQHIYNGTPYVNRSHLIAHSLAGENDNKYNLITGTNYMNHEMIKHEKMVKDYIENNPQNHVLYRVTPVFKDTELMARGVLMEAYSVEDKGYGLQFCVYYYNKEPELKINYQTGESSLS